jgi:hypothetical protein
MTTVVVLDGNSYTRCLKCEPLVPFFTGEQGALTATLNGLRLMRLSLWIAGFMAASMCQPEDFTIIANPTNNGPDRPTRPLRPSTHL